MRLDINLASQPYEDARQFWMRWGTAVGAVALLTLVLLALDVTGWVNARRDRAAIAEKRAMIADRDQLRADAERILNLPQNRTTRDESQFLNELIERKAFSWTRVLENLEKVMPPRVHLIAISPQLDEDNQLGLKMTVAGDSRDRAIELARRMEESRRFSQTNVISERSEKQSNTGDTEQVDIVAIYIPEPLAAAAQPKTEMKPKTDVKSKTQAKPKTAAPKGVAHNARLAANPEELEDRSRDHGGRGSAGGHRVFFAAGWLGGKPPQEMNPLQAELTTKTRQVAPLKDLPQKVVLASHQITDFYKTRFPSQNSQILTEFGKLAAANGVAIEQVKYKLKDAETGGLEPVEMEASLSGNYTSLAKFINALERDQMFFIIDSVTLGGQQQGPVKLGMKLETYLKAGT